MAELAAIGLASNLLQFAEFGVKLFVLARSIYKSGSVSENEALEAEAWRLANLAADIRKLCKKDNSAITRSELRSIANECDETARGLIDYLNNLDLGVKTGDKVYKKVWTSMAQALRHMTNSGETKSFEIKLGKLQAKLRTYLAAAAARNQVDILDIVKGLRVQNAKLETQTTEKLDDIVQRIESTHLDMRKQQADEFGSQLTRLKKEIFDFAEEMYQVEKKQRILQSLRFIQMRDRQNAILPHHEATFNWIFEHQDTTFPKWLESEGDIFWIRGKPGSGKSTLMKFLAGHPTTKAKLQCWGGEKKVVMASHYFWNAGNSMQKSQRGLLQTLLFEVLRELPDLIETVCGDRWDASDHTMADPWDEAELVAAFNALALKTETDLPTKFCFFIDGLDEYTAGEQRYHGMFDELLQTLYKLVSLPSIKICASSRPWDAFDLSLGPRVMEWRLQVEDLTRGDIKKYVNENLEGNADYKELAEGDSRFSQIAGIVVNRAQGVFLWVYLIVRSLIRGLAKADTFEELLARLNKLPSDLGDYFRHMLESIESNYWENTSRIFRIMIASGQALPLLAFEFLDREEKNPNYALQMDLKSFPLETISSTYKRLKKRVEARGRDLLHISEHPDTKFLQFQVDFLHRTVRDFFRDTGAMDQTIRLRETNEFSPLVSLCRIMLACGKALPYPDEMPVDCNQVFLFADGLMYYAWRIEDECSTDVQGCISPSPEDETNLEDSFELLDELDRSIAQRLNEDGFHWSNYRDLPKGNFKELRKKTFLATAIQSRLSLYVQYKVKDRSLIDGKGGRPLLDYALRPTMVTPLQPEQPIPEGPVSSIVDHLLDKGADPNQKLRFYEQQTPWELFLTVCLSHSIKGDKYSLKGDEIAKTMLVMISHGADTHVTRENRHGDKIGILEIARGLDLPKRKFREIEDAIKEKEKCQEAVLSSGILGYVGTWIWGAHR